ncbi:unnamed protein product [Alternaria burnsii]|nr:unnamed protein product [Alternaria burnsii]
MDVVDIFPENPVEPSIKYAGGFHTAFTVPWATGRVAPCAGLNTQRVAKDTLFVPFSAFKDAHAAPLHYRECQITSIEDQSNSDIADQSELGTFALSASVGGSFLGASGRGSYEKNVRDSSNKSNISIRAEHTCGQIVLSRAPELDPGAVRLLQFSVDPINEFRRKYGDFYVAGYQVGAVNNTTIYGELADKSFFEAKRAELEIKALFLKKHKSINEESYSASNEGGLDVSAFDSLTASYLKFTARTYKESLLAGEIVVNNKQLAMEIARRASKVLETDFLLGREGTVSLNMIDRLCDKGLITELLLVPFASLREYQTLLARRNMLNRLL